MSEGHGITRANRTPGYARTPDLSAPSLKAHKHPSPCGYQVARDTHHDCVVYSHYNGDGFVFPNRDGGKLDNWNRISGRLQKASGTSDWTRHDLRRTGSTLLEELQVPIQTIDAILDHTNRFAKADVSGSAGHYMVATRILNDVEDPKVVALTKLSAALDHIVATVKPSNPA